MRALPRRTIGVTVVLISFVLICVAFSAPPEKRFKNLKVLPKSIGENELDSIMKTFTRGLGVKCTFCHVENADQKVDYISDAKPEKNIARKMIRMTGKINKKYFDYARDDKGNPVEAMTCFSCHHGVAHPAKNPPPRQQRQNQAPPNQN